MLYRAIAANRHALKVVRTNAGEVLFCTDATGYPTVIRTIV
jgi:hypothetical protein